MAQMGYHLVPVVNKRPMPFDPQTGRFYGFTGFLRGMAMPVF
jgi:hypothetical protein